MYKYRLKEDNTGATDIYKGITSTVTDVDPESKSTTWNVEYNADLGYLIKEFLALQKIVDNISAHYPDDEFLEKLSTYVKQMRSSYNSHLKKNYAKQYKDIKHRINYLKEDEELDEESTSDGAGGYNTPFAFNKDKNAKGAATKYYYKLGYKLAK